MSCRYASVTDEFHGWKCSETEGACMFLAPDEKKCYEEYGEGPLAFENQEPEQEKKLLILKTPQDLIDRIKELCGEKKYDYMTLSRKSGVPLTTILNIVKGNTKNPGIFTILKICEGFEMTPGEFLIHNKDLE